MMNTILKGLLSFLLEAINEVILELHQSVSSDSTKNVE